MKQTWPAATRNEAPILEVLRRVLPAQGLVLEIASGTGQHAAAFAHALPGLRWQPTDVDPAHLASIAAWVHDTPPPAPLPPLHLDVTHEPWPVEAADAVVCSNLIHIAPWSTCLALLAGSGRILPPGGVFVLYGPYFVQDRPTAPSNLAFDASLRERDPRWGVRWLHEVVAAAAEQGLVLQETVEMPANNLTVVFRRESMP